MIKKTLPLLLVVLPCACATLGPQLPQTPGERASAFGYIPLDGLAVLEEPDPATCKDTTGEIRMSGSLLTALPDLSVRFAVASLTADGALTFGPAKVTTAGSVYRAVLDYVNVDALPVDFFLRKFVRGVDGSVSTRPLSAPLGQNEEVVGYEAHIEQGRLTLYDNLTPDEEEANSKRLQELATNFDQVTVPVYVGIGMRLSADLRALKGGVALTSLGAIASEAQANALSGTLTVQTLGVTGKSIATALPLPSKLDQTTVENGILALGTSRSILYSAGTTGSDVTTTPRIVGLYSPVGSDPRLINAIYSELSQASPSWPRTCR